MVLPSQRAGGQLLSLSQASVPGLSRPSVTPGSMRPLPGPRPRTPPKPAGLRFGIAFVWRLLMQIKANNVVEEAPCCPSTPGQIHGVPLPINEVYRWVLIPKTEMSQGSRLLVPIRPQSGVVGSSGE